MLLRELFISRTVLGARYDRQVPRDRTSVQATPARGLSRRAGFLLVQLGTHRHRRFAERLAPLDLHPRHFGMLSQLAVNEGQSQQALSSALGIHRSAVVALVDDLERGLAERRRDPVDRRAYALYLTPPGRELLAELERAADEDEAELLTALDGSERSQLISLLQRVAESQGLTAGFIPTSNRDKATITSPEGRPDSPCTHWANVPLKEGVRDAHRCRRRTDTRVPTCTRRNRPARRLR
jgi:DNA-binding MarR family transcriptional regulator